MTFPVVSQLPSTANFGDKVILNGYVYQWIYAGWDVIGYDNISFLGDGVRSLITGNNVFLGNSQSNVSN